MSSPNSPSSALQANLRKFREMRGMTQSEMGARADIALSVDFPF